jgi:hypothetical protein
LIPLFIFYIHIVFVVALFTRRWQEEGLGEGVLSVFFAGLIFFVGWSMSSFLVKIFMKEEAIGFLDRDSVSLLLLTVAEAIFYYFYFREERAGDEPSKLTGTEISGGGS